MCIVFFVSFTIGFFFISLSGISGLFSQKYLGGDNLVYAGGKQIEKKVESKKTVKAAKKQQKKALKKQPPKAKQMRKANRIGK